MKKIMSLGFSPKAYIRVEPEWGKDDQIFVSMRANEETSPEYSVVLDASGIKKLRKHLKKALEAIEGVEDEEEEETTSNAPIPKFSVGDKVIITKEGSHGFRKGEEVTLVRYQPTGWQHYEASNGEENGWLGFHEFEPA